MTTPLKLPLRKLKQLARLTIEIEKAKAALAADRNNLRSLTEEVEGILESADSAVDAFDSAVRSLNEGVETLSQYL